MASTAEISPTDTFETIFSLNPHERPEGRQQFQYRATHADDKRAPRVILSTDRRISPGRRYRVRVTKVARHKGRNRGYIEVAVVTQTDFVLNEPIRIERSIERLLKALVETNQNVLLVGPPGSAKSWIPGMIAKTCGWHEPAHIDCCKLDQVTDAFVRLSPNGESQPTDALLAIRQANAQPYDHFGLFFDELNRASPSVFNRLMPLFDSTPTIRDPITSDLLYIPKKNCHFFAAMNSPSHGCTAAPFLDLAHRDRFAQVDIGYPSAGDELAYLRRKCPDASEDRASQVVTIANALRAKCAFVSVRATCEVCSLLAHSLYSEVSDDEFAKLVCDTFSSRATSTGPSAVDAAEVQEVTRKVVHG